MRPRRPAKPATPEAAADLLHQHAIQMIDKADGHGADWPVVAQLLFRAAFLAVDSAPLDERMRSVLRRVEAGFYDRLAGNEAAPMPMPLGLGTDQAPTAPGQARAPRPKPPR